MVRKGNLEHYEIDENDELLLKMQDDGSSHIQQMKVTISKQKFEDVMMRLDLD